MRHALACTLVATVVLAAPAQAATTPHNSWGKAGVAFDDYRRDAIECGVAAYRTDLTGTQEVATLRQATRQLEQADVATAPAAVMSGPGSGAGAGSPVDVVDQAQRFQQIEAGARVDRQIKGLRKLMDTRLGQCLSQRGYRQFALTDAQRDQLRQLKVGTPERHRFLYALASDPAVLAAQALPAS